MTHLTLQAVTKRFNAAYAVDHVDLSVPDGKLVCFLGPSGCGKTTLLRMIAGLETPSSGSVTFAGRDITHLSANQRDFGMVFQSLALFPHMSVAENIAYPLRLRKTSKVAQGQRVAELLELIQLPHMANRPVTQLSGGQRQRVAIARAIASSPKLLLLDEPLSALDAKVRAELRDQIRSLQQRLEITTVFVTHDQEEALSMADRVCVMSSGHNEQTATPPELYSRPATPFVAEFVGISSRYPVDRTGNEVVVFGQTCRVRSGEFVSSDVGFEVLLRPEDVAIEIDPDAKAFVTHRSFLGATTRLIVQVGEIPIRVDVRSDFGAQLELGTRVQPRVVSTDVLVAPRKAVVAAVDPAAG